MRLGVYPCEIVDGSWADRAYDEPLVYERHRHRFEVNNAYREEFEAAGFWPTGLSPDGRLVEIMEMVDEPFMVGVQFHPEFLSRPNRPHGLFREFIGVAMDTLREGGQHVLPLGPTADALKGVDKGLLVCYGEPVPLVCILLDTTWSSHNSRSQLTS